MLVVQLPNSRETCQRLAYSEGRIKRANIMTPVHEELLQEFRNSAKSAATAESLMDHMAQRLHEKVTRYNWGGFYLDDPAMLRRGRPITATSPWQHRPARA